MVFKRELVAIRDMEPDDLNFIYASWLRGLYYGESVYSEMKKQPFMEAYHTIIEMFLKMCTVKIACLKDQPDAILGYSVLAPGDKALHWVFVKKSWRGIGIAKDLVPSSINTYTQFTKVGLSIAKRKEWSFNPFII